MPNNVRIHTEVTGNAAKEIGNVKDAWTTFQKKGAEGLAIGGGITVAAKAFQLLDTALAKSIDFLAEGVQGAMDEEAGIESLTQALHANVKGWDGNTDAIEETIKARERLAFADDEQRDALTNLVARTKDVTVALGLERTAMDLARLKKIDLAQASEIVGKVYSGNTAVLTRYGIAVSKGATATQALGEIQKMSAGQAREFADGTKGSIESLQIEVQDLGEDLGKDLLPAVRDVAKWGRDELVPFLAASGNAMRELSDEAAPFVAALKMSVGINPFPTPRDEAVDKVKAMMQATRDLADEGSQVYAAMHAAKRGINSAGDAAGDQRPRIKGLGGAANKAAEQFGDLKRNVDDAAQAIAEAAFGPEELRLEFAKTRLELKDNQDELAAVEKKIQGLKDKGKPIPRELRERFLDLRSAIVDNRQALIETGIRLQRLGGIKMDKLQQEFEDAGIDLSKLKGDAAVLWSLLKKIAATKIDPVSWSQWNDHGRASGGFTAAGDSAVVGERGMESVKALPGGGFMTYPLDGRGAFGISPQASVSPLSSGGSAPPATGSQGGSPIILQLVMDGRVMASMLAPGVTAWQQERQLIARR